MDAEAASSKRGVLSRLTGLCARKPAACLALIIVLSIIVIVLVVKYRGLLGFGPYPKASKSAMKAAKAGGDPAADKEVDELINKINNAA